METKAMKLFENLTPELKQAVVSISETIKPVLDEIHKHPPTTQNYYGDYMRILSYKPEKKQILALAMLYAGCNPSGVESAVKLI